MAKTRPISDLKKLVAKYQKVLGLAHWEIEVAITSEAVDWYADTQMSDTYDIATITFHDSWTTWDSKKLGRTVIHELLHLHARDLDQVIEAARLQLHPQASAQIDKRYGHEIEGFVDRIAARIYDLLPAT